MRRLIIILSFGDAYDKNPAMLGFQTWRIRISRNSHLWPWFQVGPSVKGKKKAIVEVRDLSYLKCGWIVSSLAGSMSGVD